jgi:hypothetical protein
VDRIPIQGRSNIVIWHIYDIGGQGREMLMETDVSCMVRAGRLQIAI